MLFMILLSRRSTSRSQTFLLRENVSFLTWGVTKGTPNYLGFNILPHPPNLHLFRSVRQPKVRAIAGGEDRLFRLFIQFILLPFGITVTHHPFMPWYLTMPTLIYILKALCSCLTAPIPNSRYNLEVLFRMKAAR